MIADGFGAAMREKSAQSQGFGIFEPGRAGGGGGGDTMGAWVGGRRKPRTGIK